MRIAFSRDPDAEREVAPLELFFDLVYVFAIGRLSHHLVAHVDVRTSAETVVLALAVFYAWRMTAWGANRLDPDPLPVRLAGPRSRVVGLAALAILAAATAPLAMIAGIAAASAVLVAVAVTDTLRDDVPPRGAPA